MWCRILVFVISIVTAPVGLVEAGPVLLFSDITSGPNTGNTDGYGDGAIVTVWGTGLGGAQNDSTLSCGGQPASHIYYWGNADTSGASGPANLYERLNLQQISFSVGESADSSGIQASINGQTSNTLSFSIGTGDIYFIRSDTNGGSDDNAGTFSLPWTSWSKAVSSMGTGDIVYIMDDVGVSEFDFSGAGTPTAPKMIIAYPGSMPVASGSTALEFNGFNGDVKWWTLSKIGFTTSNMAIRLEYNEVGTESGLRIVGCYVTGTGDPQTKVGAFNLQSGAKNKVLGCEAEGINSTYKLHHVLYISAGRGGGTGIVEDWEVGWNYVHHNTANRGINVFQEEESHNEDCKNSERMHNLSVHDNWVEEQGGTGLNVNAFDECMTGTIHVYNNVIYHAGKTDGLGYSDTTFFGLLIQPGGHSSVPTDVHVYNNTVYKSGDSHPRGWSTDQGALYAIENANTQLTIQNNIFIPWDDSAPYESSSNNVDSVTGKNCFYGGSGTVHWDTDQVLTDPQFVNETDTALDLRLTSTSDCKDGGNNTSAIVATDILGIPRPQNDIVDIGAYEYAPDTPDTIAPSIIEAHPAGEQACASDPQAVVVSCTTDEWATCRYGDPEADWSAMTPMPTTHSTNHSHSLMLACGQTYQYDVLCRDASSNESAPERVEFSVGAAAGQNDPDSGSSGSSGGCFLSGITEIVIRHGQ